MLNNLRHAVFATIASVFVGAMFIAAAAGPAITAPLA